MLTKILVVDDSLAERVLVEGILRRNPAYEVKLAANGREALDVISTDVPDVVVTDLVMPEMDGLELVRTIRDQHPGLPVILMTAYGDEMTAVEALEAGAASYVPKAQKAERLMSAVERVTDYCTANRTRLRLTRSMLEYHCRFAIENDRRLIHTLVIEIQQAMAGMEIGDNICRIQVSEALEEALLNAMYHGNLEFKREELAEVRAELDDHMFDRLMGERSTDPRFLGRKILVIAHLKEDDARFVIRDEGRGFNTAFLSNRAALGRTDSGRDRGMTLIHCMMDEVKFNRSGNELVMRKKMRASSPSQPPRTNRVPAWNNGVV